MTEVFDEQSNLLKERLKQQELISEISQNFISSGEIKLQINEALAKLGHYYEVSRVIIVNLDYKSGDVSLKYYWSADNKTVRMGNFNVYDFVKARFPERMYSSFTVPIASCSDTRSNKNDDYSELIIDNIYAFICTPLYVKGLMWGLLVVDQCHAPRQWTDSEKSFISVTASTIAGAITLDIYNTKLKDALENVTAASRAKSEFLSNMSHEMRTPMNAIINMTTIAKNTDEIEQKNYALDKIKDASTHLLGVINDILDMSKIEANKYELTPAEFNFEKMLSQVVNVVNFRVEEKKQTLTVNIDKNIPKYLIGDSQRISQIITNLLGNAVKFTPDNGSIGLCTEFLGEENDVCTIQISIADTGIGISEEMQKHLFQPFQQLETSMARKYEGTGLGLSISKSFVEMMGGKVSVNSEPGKGSVFSFTIQVRRCVRSGDEEIEERQTKDSASKQKENTYDFSGRRILIVEDIELNREIVLTLLKHTNLEVDCAENGLIAVKMFMDNPEKYEIIFMDIHMPAMDGYEAARQIRLHEEKLKSKSGRLKRIPIIAMTANVFKEDIERCFNAGMDGHLGKPLDIERLIENLQIYLL